MRFQTRRLTGKYRSPLITVLVAALALLLLQPTGAVAGTIFVNDLAEGTPTVTFSGDVVGRASFNCIAEACGITVLPPAGFTGAPTGATDVNITPGTGEKTGTTVSDTLKFVVFGVPSGGTSGVAHFNFTSDPGTEAGLAALGTSTIGLGAPISIAETGGTQTATSFSWGTLATDTVTFASDVSQENPPAPVPEPATLLLLGTGLIGIGLWGQGRLRRRVNG